MSIASLVWLAPLWPVIAIACAVFFYVRHCRLVEPGRRVSVILYILAAGLCGGVLGVAGIFLGIDWACAGPNPGNLCGLAGFLVTGPIAGSLGVILVALALLLVRPAQQSSIPAAR